VPIITSPMHIYRYNLVRDLPLTKRVAATNLVTATGIGAMRSMALSRINNISLRISMRACTTATQQYMFLLVLAIRLTVMSIIHFSTYRHAVVYS